MKYLLSALALAAFVGCSNPGMTPDGAGGSGATGMGGLGIAGAGIAGIGGSGNGGTVGVAGGGAGIGGGPGGSGGAEALCANDGDSQCPACSGTPDAIVQCCVLDDQQQLVRSGFSGMAKIASIAEVASADSQCAGVTGLSVNKPVNRIGLEMTGRAPLTVFLGVPDLPADRLVPGDMVDVEVFAGQQGWGFGQHVVLSRAGKVLAFATSEGYWPSLTSIGLSLEDAGALCGRRSCTFVSHSARVKAGGGEAVLEPGQTSRLGTMSVSFSRALFWNSMGGCDAGNHVEVGGFDTAAN